jgi:hypothetical protein
VDKVPVTLMASLTGVKSGSPLFSIDPDVVVERILSCPAFQEAKVWRLLPGTLGIEYRLKKPACYLAGFRNVCCDEQGSLFFLLPYFPPKKLPQLVLPLERADSLQELQRKVAMCREKDFAFQLLPHVASLASSFKLYVESIDFSAKNHPNIFRREIILVFGSPLGRKGEYIYVRCNGSLLSMKKMRNIFSNLLASGFEPAIIDMRFPSCILIKKGN